MLKIITCPEQNQPAKLHTHPRLRGGEQVIYCSLWESDQILEACKESCVPLLNSEEGEKSDR